MHGSTASQETDIDHALSNPVTVHYFDGYVIVVGPSRTGHLIEVGVNDDDFVFHANVRAREVLEEEVNMKTTEEMLDEIENANNGDGPDPVATVDDPALAKIAFTQIRLRVAERALDEAVMDARDACRS